MQYQSANFDISLPLPILEGESAQHAMDRVDAIVSLGIKAKAKKRMEELYEHILLTMQQADEQKRSFDR